VWFVVWGGVLYNVSCLSLKRRIPEFRNSPDSGGEFLIGERVPAVLVYYK
jgi:hypothetical protein